MRPFFSATARVESFLSSTFLLASRALPPSTRLPPSSFMPSVVPPGASMKPVMVMSAMRHWPSCVPLGFSSTARPQARDEGLAEPYIRAAFQMSSSSTPQISAARDGGISLQRSASSS